MLAVNSVKVVHTGFRREARLATLWPGERCSRRQSILPAWLKGPCQARAGRAIEAYLIVRRGAQPSATQPWRMDPALGQKTREKFGLGPIAGFG